MATARKGDLVVAQPDQRELSKDILKGILISSLICLASSSKLNISIFFIFLIPLPILFYRIKLGRANGLLIAISTNLLMMIFHKEGSFNLSQFTELMVLGFVMGELIEKNLSVEKTLLYTTATVLLSEFLALLFYSNFSHKGIKALLTEYVANNLEFMLDQQERSGLIPEETVQIISTHLEEIQYIIVGIIPGLATTSILFMSWICLLLAKPLLKNRNLHFPDFGPLNQWKVSEYLVWAVLGSGLFFLLPNRNAQILGLNGLFILALPYLFQGFAIISFLFEKKHFPLFFKFFTYSFIILQPIIWPFIMCLGFVDFWINFRRL